MIGFPLIGQHEATTWLMTFAPDVQAARHIAKHLDRRCGLITD
jgi:hypothetical protein